VTNTRHEGLRRLYSYHKKARQLIMAGLILSAISGILDLVAPLLLSFIMDEFADNVGHFTEDYSILLAINSLIVIVVISFITATVKNNLVSRGSIILGMKLRMDLFSKMGRIPFSKLMNMRTGDTTSILANDCDKVSSLSGQVLDSAIRSIVLVVGSAAMMFYIDEELALVSIFPISSSVLLIVFYAKSMDRYYYKQSKAFGKANDRIAENFRGHAIIKTSSSEEKFKRQFEKINNVIRKRTNKLLNGVTLIPTLMKFLTNIGYVSICGYGILMIQDGRASFGVLIASLVYMKLFTQPIDDLSVVALDVKTLEGASERIFDVLDAEEIRQQELIEKDDFEGAVEFEHVWFSYDGKRDVIKNFSFKAEAGDTVAVVGLSGSGKTTLMNLMMGFYMPHSGEIRIDGIPLTDLSKNQIRNMFSLVAQDSWVFKGTYKDNIIYNSENITDEELQEVCRIAGMDFVKDLPEGLDTYIEEPSALSLGQKQQICVARAMAHKAPILVMDEITNSIDIKTERSIIDSISHMQQRRTTFVVAHRLSTIKTADLVIVIEDGCIKESGRMQELIAKRGIFYEMVAAQNGAQF
jgi:ATP-binding cassette subfamily B protein